MLYNTMLLFKDTYTIMKFRCKRSLICFPVIFGSIIPILLIFGPYDVIMKNYEKKIVKTQNPEFNCMISISNQAQSFTY